jgi:hypothetical protein
MAGFTRTQQRARLTLGTDREEHTMSDPTELASIARAATLDTVPLLTLSGAREHEYVVRIDEGRGTVDVVGVETAD